MTLRKRANRLLLVVGLLALSVLFIFITDFSGGRPPAWGVTFSRSYALDLQLDWQQTYLALLDELNVSHIRLSAYWDEIEANRGEFDFSSLDWQIQQATDRGRSIVLAVGRRLPRWPECHDPGWLKHLPNDQTEAELLELLETTIKRYQSNEAVVMWQGENEPLFTWFGFCPPPSKDFFFREVALVKTIDPTRPVLVTDSGELSAWQSVSNAGDVLGTTLYRVVWNKWFGFFDYWFLPPAYYRWKADITKKINPNINQVIISELQMEPWTFNKRMIELTREEQEQSFDLSRFKRNVTYARRIGTPAVYLWGAEYWYWLKLQGQPAIWEEAKKLWSD